MFLTAKANLKLLTCSLKYKFAVETEKLHLVTPKGYKNIKTNIKYKVAL